MLFSWHSAVWASLKENTGNIISWVSTFSNFGAGDESPLDTKEIKPVNPKGNQPWIFIGRADAEVEAPVVWTPDAKRQLIGKDPDAGKDWRHEEKGETEDNMFEWHHWLNRHESVQTLGPGEGQGILQLMESQRGRHDLVTEQHIKVGQCSVHFPVWLNLHNLLGKYDAYLKMWKWSLWKLNKLHLVPQLYIGRPVPWVLVCQNFP